MKDLKENIKKNNMKKLLLSAVLGMFCYCTNNAAENSEEEKEENPEEEENQIDKNMEEPINIDKIFNIIILHQIYINNASVPIEQYKKKIYSAIKEEGKVIKKKVLEFITNLYTPEEQNEEWFKDNINQIEQYFHLEELEQTDECKGEDLTEIFWKKTEEPVATINEEEKGNIKEYFNTIIKMENILSTVLNSYYNAKKTQKEGATEEDILGEIMKDLCGEEEGDRVSNLIGKLGNKLKEDVKEEVKEYILAIIKRRITLSNKTEQEEKDFIYFLKQKIGIKEKKGGNPGVEKGGNPAKEEGCPCCNDCCGNE